MATSYGTPPTITNRSGQTISAKWLTDQNGNYIIDPLTSKPYLVSADFDFQKFVTLFQNAKAYADTFPSSVERSGFIAGILLRFAPGAEFDIQRSYGGVVPGYFEGGSRFVSAFTDAANFVYGVACNTVGLTQNECLAGGGAAKLVSATLSSQPVGSLSDWFNPPNK